MKWLVYCPDEYYRQLWDYYLRKTNNLICLFASSFQDLDRFEFERLVCCQENKYLAQEAKEKGIITYFVGQAEPKNKDIYHGIYLFNNLKNIIDKAYDIKTIPETFSATNMAFFMPWLIKKIKNKDSTEGICWVADKENYLAADIKEYYALDIKSNEAETKEINIRLNGAQNFKSKASAKINIYLPTYYRLEKTKKSILSIIETGKKSKHDVKIYIGDNNTKLADMKSWLRNLEGAEVYFHPENVGKANIVNLLHKKARICDYIFSIDSDMVVESQPYHPFDRMIDILERCDNIGLVSSNQKDCNQHWFGRGVEQSNERGFPIGFSPNGVGIAGGCIVMRTHDWDEIGGYKENHDIYTGDDGILTYNVIRLLGKKILVSLDAYLVHPMPGEEERGYTEWKSKSWQRDQLNFIKDNYTGSNKKGYYD